MKDTHFTVEAGISSFFGVQTSEIDVELKPDGSATLTQSGVVITLAASQVEKLQTQIAAHAKSR